MRSLIGAVFTSALQHVVQIGKDLLYLSFVAYKMKQKAWMGGASRWSGGLDAMEMQHLIPVVDLSCPKEEKNNNLVY